MKPSVKIHGKWLAIAAGLNQYEKADAEFRETVRSYNAGKYKKQTPIEKKIATMSVDVIETMLKDYGIDDIDTAVSGEPASVLMEAVTKEASLLATSENEIKARPTAMAAVIEETAGIQRGMAKESEALDKYQEVTGNIVEKRNAKLHELYIDCPSARVIVRSMFDGVGERGEIIETKHRRNRFFSYIPVYEKVQLEVYMRAAGVNSAVHIQNFGGEQKTTEYKADNVFWAEVCSKLEEFMKVYLAEEQ